MAFSANPRIALMARGARFLKATPWICCPFRQSCFSDTAAEAARESSVGFRELIFKGFLGSAMR